MPLAFRFTAFFAGISFCLGALAPLLSAQETRLSSLATRAQVGIGANQLFTGFVVGPGSSRTVLIRAAGPTLSPAPFGLGTAALADPLLTLFNGANAEIARNDNWGTPIGTTTLATAATFSTVGAFPFSSSNSLDAALIATLPPGPYSAIVGGVGNTTGIAIIELYEIGAALGSNRLTSISARAQVGIGAAVTIPGINISAGPGTRRLLIRAAGPALTPLGVPGVLADPTLAVTNPTASTTYAANNDWGTPIGTNPASAVAIAAAIANYTGYPFAAGSRDSAVIADLAPGAYTVQVSGVADTSGVALVEIYDITQETQTITFAALSDRITTSAPQNLSATASSGLSVTFSVISGPATITGNVLTLVGTPGTVEVRAAQAGNLGFSAAPPLDRTFTVSPQPPTPSGVSTSRLASRTVGSTALASSTRLTVSWTPPAGGTINHYRITAIDAVGGLPLTFTASPTETSAELSGLKAATAYSITVSASADAAGTVTGSASAVQFITDKEYWQLQGIGNTTAGLSKIVSDGNARISATRFGPEAGSATANRIQLYYGPSLVTGRQTLSTALTASATSAALPSSYLSFVSSMATTGLLTPTPPATMIQEIATGQAVPLSAAMGGKVRVFFEAKGVDGKTRIFSIDSVDGYTGQDFNSSGSSTICSTTADFSSGGGCAFKVVIGVEGDAVAGNPRILNARQNKVGYPTQTDWRWDGAPGTFMVFTSGRVAGCSTADRTHGYAVWNGSTWDVQYTAAGCPKLFNNVQAAFPMHIGGVRYKLYYGDTSDLTGKLPSQLPFLGPKRLLYADGAKSSLADRVDFEDWESQSAARDVAFLWPNGDLLDATAEGYIDDYHFMAPTGSLELQVMYLAITNGTAIPFGAAAILLNP